MPLNPASLSKCYDCPVSSGEDCLHQCSVIAGTGMDGTYIDDSAFQLAVPCTDRRTGATYDFSLWRMENQAYLSSGGSEFPSSYVTGDGFDPEDGDATYTGPYDS